MLIPVMGYLGGLSIHAAQFEQPAQLLATSPSGTFHLELDDAETSPIMLVPTKHPEQRLALPAARVFIDASEPADPHQQTSVPIATTSDLLEYPPLTFISPDERWIFVAQNTNNPKGPPDTVGYLYRRTEGAESTNDLPHFEFAQAERFDKLAFDFLAKEEKYLVERVGEPDEDGIRTDAIFFGGWSADSVRLLVALDGAIGKPLPGNSYTHWLCYFNTKTCTFERTERLRTADKIVMTEVNPPEDGRVAVLHAEALGKEGPIVPVKEIFENADANLNKIYAELLNQLAPMEIIKLRQEERNWLDDRDTFAAVHACQSWTAFPAASEKEWRAVASDARTVELRERLGQRPVRQSAMRGKGSQTKESGLSQVRRQ